MGTICLLDFETEVVEPFDPKRMRIIEIGAVLWDTERKLPLEMLSRLVWSEAHTFHPMITAITGLTLPDLQRRGKDPRAAIGELLELVDQAECIVAHNGKGFDRIVFEAETERHGIPMPPHHWVDTTTDVPYPERIETRKLYFLAPSHGFLNPFAHRALFDALTMGKVLSHYSWDEILANSKVPDVRVRAVISKPYGPTEAVGKKEVELAKARGYRFEKDAAGNGLWIKRIKENKWKEEEAQAPFRVVMLKDL